MLKSHMYLVVTPLNSMCTYTHIHIDNSSSSKKVLLESTNLDSRTIVLECQNHLDTWPSLCRDSVSVCCRGGPGILCFIISLGDSQVQPKLRISDPEENNRLNLGLAERERTSCLYAQKLWSF